MRDESRQKAGCVLAFISSFIPHPSSLLKVHPPPRQRGERRAEGAQRAARPAPPKPPLICAFAVVGTGVDPVTSRFSVGSSGFNGCRPVPSDPQSRRSASQSTLGCSPGRAKIPTDSGGELTSGAENGESSHQAGVAAHASLYFSTLLGHPPGRWPSQPQPDPQVDLGQLQGVEEVAPGAVGDGPVHGGEVGSLLKGHV